MTVRKRQQRHQLPCPARRPIALRNLAAPDHDAETSQQLNAHIDGHGLHDTILSDTARRAASQTWGSPIRDREKIASSA
jgi:hypothetical protein